MASRAGSARPPDQAPVGGAGVSPGRLGRRRLALRAVCPLSTASIASPARRAPGIAGAGRADQLAHRLLADAGHARDVADAFTALAHRGQGNAAFAPLPGTAFVGLRLQCRHPLVEPVIDRIRALACRQEHRQIVHVRAGAAGQIGLRGYHGLARCPPCRLRRCTTCHGHTLSPSNPLMPHPNSTTFHHHRPHPPSPRTAPPQQHQQQQLSRPVEGCVQMPRACRGSQFRSGRSWSRSSRFTLQFRRPAHPACRAAAARSASPLSAEILPARARKSPQIREVLPLHRCGTDRAPLQYQVRHCRRGTNPGHPVERGGRWPR